MCSYGVIRNRFKKVTVNVKYFLFFLLINNVDINKFIFFYFSVVWIYPNNHPHFVCASGRGSVANLLPNISLPDDLFILLLIKHLLP